LAYRLSRSFDVVPAPLRRSLERTMSLAARPGRPGRLRGPRRNLWKYMRAVGQSPYDRYLSFLSYYQQDELDTLLTPYAKAAAAGYDPFARHRKYMVTAPTQGELSRLLY